MSGSAGLAAAKRRRAGPSINSEPPRQNNIQHSPIRQRSSDPVQAQMPPSNTIINSHPLIILSQHEQQINKINSNIEDIYDTLNKNTTNKAVKSTPVDEESVHFFKTKYESMSREMDEMKRLLIKIQTFSMETNLELLKMKRLLKNDTRLTDNDEDICIDNLTIRD